MSKTVPSSYDGQPFTMTNRLMSDGVVLRKSGKSWTVKGKLKPGVTANEWIANKREGGWTVEGGWS